MAPPPRVYPDPELDSFTRNVRTVCGALLGVLVVAGFRLRWGPLTATEVILALPVSILVCVVGRFTTATRSGTPSLSSFGIAEAAECGRPKSCPSRPSAPGRQPPQTGNVPGNKMSLPTLRISRCPQNAIVMSSSLRKISRHLVTPASPIAPRP